MAKSWTYIPKGEGGTWLESKLRVWTPCPASGAKEWEPGLAHVQSPESKLSILTPAQASGTKEWEPRFGTFLLWSRLNDSPAMWPMPGLYCFCINSPPTLPSFSCSSNLVVSTSLLVSPTPYISRYLPPTPLYLLHLLQFLYLLLFLPLQPLCLIFQPLN